jgi:hypothetical protein
MQMRICKSPKLPCRAGPFKWVQGVELLSKRSPAPSRTASKGHWPSSLVVFCPLDVGLEIDLDSDFCRVWEVGEGTESLLQLCLGQIGTATVTGFVIFVVVVIIVVVVVVVILGSDRRIREEKGDWGGGTE